MSRGQPKVTASHFLLRQITTRVHRNRALEVRASQRAPPPDENCPPDGTRMGKDGETTDYDTGNGSYRGPLVALMSEETVGSWRKGSTGHTDGQTNVRAVIVIAIALKVKVQCRTS